MKKIAVILVLIGFVSAAVAEYEVIDVKLTVKGITLKGKKNYKYKTERLGGMLITHVDSNDVENCWFVLYDKKDCVQMDCDLSTEGYAEDDKNGHGIFVAKLAVMPMKESDLDLYFKSIVIGRWRTFKHGAYASGHGTALMEAEDMEKFDSMGYSKNVIMRLNWRLSCCMNEAEDPEAFIEAEIARRIRKKAHQVDIDLGN